MCHQRTRSGSVLRRASGFDRGSLVIEYLGVGGESFLVTTPHREIVVTGTVLFVSVDEETNAGVGGRFDRGT